MNQQLFARWKKKKKTSSENYPFTQQIFVYSSLEFVLHTKGFFVSIFPPHCYTYTKVFLVLFSTSLLHSCSTTQIWSSLTRSVAFICIFFFARIYVFTLVFLLLIILSGSCFLLQISLISRDSIFSWNWNDFKTEI